MYARAGRMEVGGMPDWESTLIGWRVVVMGGEGCEMADVMWLESVVWTTGLT